MGLIRRLDFLSLVLAVLGAAMFIFDPLFLPREDAKTKLELFYFFYNSLMQDGAWPLWMPLHTFGLPSALWQWVGLTPAHYAAIIGGKIFGINDVPLLFKACQLMNQLFFVTGLYVLSRALWENRAIAWFVCLGCGIFHWWFIDLDMKFNVFYLLPWELWLLVTFFRQGQAWRLWAAGAGLIAWEMGNCLYYIFLWGWLLAVFAAVMWWTHRHQCKPDFRRFSALAMMALCIVLAAGFYWQFHDFLGGTADLQRLAGAGKNTLADFMTYGPVPVYQGTWENMIHYFVLGDVREIYLPTVLFVFALWAACFVRQPVALALMAMTGSLIWFSFKGWLTYASFFLPGMALFHDAGNTYGLTKVLIALLAGYGLQDFLNADKKVAGTFFIWIALGLVIAVDGLGLTKTFAAQMFAQNRDPLMNIARYPWGLRLIAVAIVGVIAVIAMKIRDRMPPGNAGGTWLRFALALWLLIDVGIYAKGFTADMAKFQWPKAQREMWNTARQPFQDMRTPYPPHERGRQLWPLFAKDTLYAPVYSVMGFDPCWPQARADFITRRLFALSNTGPINAEIIACMHPKLRFVQGAAYADTMQEALSLIRARGIDPNKPVIETLHQVLPRLKLPDQATHVLAEVIAFDQNRLKVKMRAPAGGGWLVYADNWHPGWRAWVNGKPALVHPADAAFKAVHVPDEGAAVIEWRFMPMVGGAISLAWVVLGVTVALALTLALIGTLVQSIKEI